MASEKVTYWMAVGLVALMMGNHFVSRVESNCLVYKSRAALERISGQAERFMALADVMLGRSSSRFDHAEAEMAVAQARLSAVQIRLARQEAGAVRVMALQRLEHVQMPVTCPRPRVNVMVLEHPGVPSSNPI
ncbi:MAG: hypothetical protein WBM11_00560 [Terriglobales bacterium]